MVQLVADTVNYLVAPVTGWLGIRRGLWAPAHPEAETGPTGQPQIPGTVLARVLIDCSWTGKEDVQEHPIGPTAAAILDGQHAVDSRTPAHHRRADDRGKAGTGRHYQPGPRRPKAATLSGTPDVTTDKKEDADELAGQKHPFSSGPTCGIRRAVGDQPAVYTTHTNNGQDNGQAVRLTDLEMARGLQRKVVPASEGTGTPRTPRQPREDQETQEPRRTRHRPIRLHVTARVGEASP